MDASRDQNHVPSKLAVLNTDGITIVPIKINPITGAIMTDMVATISYTPTPIDREDKNFVDVWLFEGSDGLTYPANATAAGALLIDI